MLSGLSCLTASGAGREAVQALTDSQGVWRFPKYPQKVVPDDTIAQIEHRISEITITIK